MPTRKTRKSKGKRKSKSGRKYNKRSKLPSSMPPAMFVKLRYVDRFENISIPIASYNQYPYVNSLYDPYSAVGGHQPMLFDQWMTLYSTYVVLGFSYDIRVTPVTNNGTLVLIATTDNNYVPSTIPTAIEQPRAKFLELSANDKTRKIKGYVSVAKLFSLTPKQVMSEQYFWGTSLSNPVASMLAYLRVLFFSTSTATFTYTADIKLTYYAKLFRPVVQTSS